jgi:hypothetical protein
VGQCTDAVKPFSRPDLMLRANLTNAHRWEDLRFRLLIAMRGSSMGSRMLQSLYRDSLGVEQVAGVNHLPQEIE